MRNTLESIVGPRTRNAGGMDISNVDELLLNVTAPCQLLTHGMKFAPCAFTELEDCDKFREHGKS